MPEGGKSKILFLEKAREFINEDVKYEDDEMYVNKDPKFKNSEDIKELLSSTLPYEEKLEILKDERNKAISLKDNIDREEEKFLNTNTYLKQMIKKSKEAKNRLKYEAPIGLLSTTATVYLGGSFINARIANVYLNTSLNESIITGCLFVGAGIATGILLSKTYSDVRDIVLYKDEIYEYRKMLKRKD